LLFAVLKSENAGFLTVFDGILFFSGEFESRRNASMSDAQLGRESHSQ
jgi:hypothetical protein